MSVLKGTDQDKRWPTLNHLVQVRILVRQPHEFPANGHKAGRMTPPQMRSDANADANRDNTA